MGFEPTEPAKVQRFSRPPDSTTLAPHRISKLPDFRNAGKRACLAIRKTGVSATPGRLRSGYNCRWKPILAGAGRGLQTRRAVLCVAGGFDSHWLPPLKLFIINFMPRWGPNEHAESWRPHSPLGENKAVLNGQEVQHAIKLKSHRLDFSANLFDTHPLRRVLWPEGVSFRKFDHD